MKYKMIFCDMDGTLLVNHRAISEENKAAIRFAKQKGVDFVICTGRGVYGVEPYLKELELMGNSGYVICQNGATVYDLRTMETILLRTFEAKDFAPIAKIAHRLGIAIQMYHDRTFMGEKITPRTEEYCKVMGTEMKIIPDVTQYDGKFSKCLLDGPREKLEILYTECQPYIKDILNVFFSGPNFLEFVPIGISKGNAMAKTAEKAGLPLSQVIAIGDSGNDVPMIEKAGLGIAVANAEAEAKAAARIITKNDCEHHAVAEVIYRFLEQEAEN